MDPTSDVQDLGPTPPAAREIFGSRLSLAEAYASSLATQGIQRGLIGPREIPRIWDRHILNSATLASVIPSGARCIDVGSGAGLPGIPLAIARPDLEVQLLEPLLRRTTYLEEVAGELELSIEVVRGRAEEGHIVRRLRGADVVTSRAVAPLGRLVRWSLPLVKKGGVMRALKGDSVHQEIERDADEIQKAGGGDVRVLEVGQEILGVTTHVVSVSRLR